MNVFSALHNILREHNIKIYVITFIQLDKNAPYLMIKCGITEILTVSDIMTQYNKIRHINNYYKDIEHKF